MVPLTDEKNFSAVFTEAVEKIIGDAKALGIPMSEICSDVGVSRATPSRWLREAPATVALVERLQGAVARRRAATEAA